MWHILAVGKTGCGKSSLFREMCEAHRLKGRRSILLEQRRDDAWKKKGKPIAMIRDVNHFLKVAHQNYNLNMVIEDAFTQIGMHPSKEIAWLGTDSRHNGHIAMFGTQKYTGFSPILRESVGYIAAFLCGATSAKAMAEEFCKPEFLKCPQLNYGEYLWYDQRANTIEKRVLFIPKNKIITRVA